MAATDWWVCPGCRTLNDLPSRRCFSCRAKRPRDVVKASEILGDGPIVTTDGEVRMAPIVAAPDEPPPAPPPADAVPAPALPRLREPVARSILAVAPQRPMSIPIAVPAGVGAARAPTAVATVPDVRARPSHVVPPEAGPAGRSGGVAGGPPSVGPSMLPPGSPSAGPSMLPPVPPSHRYGPNAPGIGGASPGAVPSARGIPTLGAPPRPPGVPMVGGPGPRPIAHRPPSVVPGGPIMPPDPRFAARPAAGPPPARPPQATQINGPQQPGPRPGPGQGPAADGPQDGGRRPS
jgi:translation initiation factor IF-2